MFLTFTLALLALAALARAFHLYRLPPNLPNALSNRLIALGLGLLGAFLSILAPLVMPLAIERDALADAKAAKIRLEAQINEIRALSDVLGGPQGYIDYLHAKAQD